MKRVSLLMGLLAVAMASTLSIRSSYASATDDQDLIDRSAKAVHQIRHQYPAPVASLLARAKAVLVYPDIIKAGFIFGASGGPGVMVVRTADGGWSQPSFVGFGSGSVGLQAGIQDSAVMILVMTDGGLNKLMNDSFKVGADANLALGPVGGGAEAGTTSNLNADMYVYTKNQGAFAGASLDGAVITPSLDRNHEYYGSDAAGPRSILFEGAHAGRKGAKEVANALTLHRAAPNNS